MHSILVTGGIVVDGTGAPAAPLDVAVDGIRIAGLYKPSEGKASLTIDARGMVVCPGFVDIHSHSELHLLSNPLAESKIRQGVTTELVGNCGGSPAPAIGAARDQLAHYASILDVNVDWSSLDEYLLRLSNMRPSVNVATLVGASTLREAVVGTADRKATTDEMSEMNKLLADAMLQGAFGLSSGLIYAPGCYAPTEELISLASTAASFGGIYTSHIRSEGRGLVAAVQEAIRIGREARIPVEISHHKVCGKAMWGTVSRTIQLIEEARKEGVDVAFDVYPYTASNTSLDTILPPWAREGGEARIIQRLKDSGTREKIVKDLGESTSEWENTVVESGWDHIVAVGFRKKHNQRFENRTLAEISTLLGSDPLEVALDLMIDEELHVEAIFHEMSEDDVIRVMSHPLASIGSDGSAENPYGPTGQCATHPRSYGTFPRVIRRYIFDKKIMSLEEGIRKMTSWPAERIGLRDRGVIAKGMAADIVVFDPVKVRDAATFEDSHRYPEGIVHVLVNGAVTIADGEHTRERAGLALRHAPAIA